MNILIAYYSETGNTEKIGEAIYAEIESQWNNVHLERINELTAGDLDGYDLVFIGSACHDADLAVPVKLLLEGIHPSPTFKLAGFATHAAYTPDGGERQREVYQEWASRCSRTFEQVSREKTIDFLGYFSCQGAPSPPIEAFIRSEIIQDEDEWAEYIAEVRNHPDEKDLDNARMFARAVLKKSKHGTA